MASRKHLSVEELLDLRRKERMALVDAATPEMRRCIHDFGLPVVRALTSLGVQKPRHIRHIVETILDEFSPTRGAKSIQGIRSVEHASRGTDD